MSTQDIDPFQHAPGGATAPFLPKPDRGMSDGPACSTCSLGYTPGRGAYVQCPGERSLCMET